MVPNCPTFPAKWDRCKTGLNRFGPPPPPLKQLLLVVSGLALSRWTIRSRYTEVHG